MMMMMNKRYSKEDAYQAVIVSDNHEGIHVLDASNISDAAKNLLDMGGGGLMGFDGGGGWASWDINDDDDDDVDECTGNYWFFIHYTSVDPRPLNLWIDHHHDGDRGSEILIGEHLAAAATGSWDKSGLQWFHCGPYQLPSKGFRIKIDSVQGSFWPHVRQFALVPALDNVPPVSNVQRAAANGGNSAVLSRPRIQKPSHPGVKARLESISARSVVLSQVSIIVAVLDNPQRMSDNVVVQPGMIYVEGPSGWYTFEFDNSSSDCHQAYLDVTFASGENRPVNISVNNEQCTLQDCCSDITGGFGSDCFAHKRYGPIALNDGLNTIQLVQSKAYFPHVGEIRIVDARKSDAGVTAKTNTNNKKTWIVPPSQEPSPEIGKMLDFCFVENTQAPNPHFQPDSSFYNGICVDGLWVLASKKVEVGVLNCAAELVSRYVPVEIRKLFLQWRAPLNMPQGPFRLIILDAASNQQAGDCPEFPDSWRGRNSTINPGVFTSSEDFRLQGNGSYCGGELTVHELTHGLDLVVRQQLDPFFMQQNEDCFQLSRSVYQKAYAAADRHEYLAEICTLFVGTNPQNFTRGCCQCGESDTGYCDFDRHRQFPPGQGGVNYRRKSDLIHNDPGGYQLLKSFLVEINNGDKFWWEL